MGRFDGRVAIVTGGARGMGEAEVRRLVDEGASVVIGDVLVEEGQALADELGDKVVFVDLDVSDEMAWEKAVLAAHEAFGPVDVLVNNAGILAWGPIDQTDPETFRRVLDVNLTGAFLGIRAVAPDMKAAGKGAIVNISSAAGLVGMQNLPAYSASKWGLRGLTKSAAMDLGHSGIRVNSIHPGGVRTPMAAGADDPSAYAGQAVTRIGEPEEIAAAVAFLASDEAANITGAELAVDGGLVLGTVR
ncbi:glucose 1-dehydrogenase [Cellulomonas fimi]|uniref:Glucose 1-dehydrogenase n=1 Tax=Cellulomonas fimi TaxID=1708 RepID=A0A7Y0LVW8_CELFI|nr:glucose 1-dehydrogenase [Cellulomonas fimi]NMR18846.1 glucose 1-dehydrogenase [Cellulomonas fimi]